MLESDRDINLQLRSEILDIALTLEDAVNALLLALLLIENPNRKAISNKSGNLSFRNKIDLLFDLDVLISEEHQNLLLLMEFRNQFLHNIKCCSFHDAVNQLGVDKEKKLLNFNDEDRITDTEYRYQNAFRNLNIKCLNILLKKVEDRKIQIEDRRKTHVRLIESQIFFINRHFDIQKRVMLICEKHITGVPEVTELVQQIHKALTDDMESLDRSEEYIRIQNELKELHTPEKLKSYFKR
jgi:hypothetical protein